MWKWIATLAGAIVLAASMSACIVHAHHGGHGHGIEVVLPVAHVCSVNCGHYQYRGRWYHHQGHVHGHGCGHILVSGTWRIE
ncbi:MAG TPA: hypothetical protein VJU16_03690 [Planctomycetota bacterium]|nr:hypothetical protein [Planctomycetota bacterium]